MRFGTNNQNKNPYRHYTCSQYGQGLKQCSAHYIRYDYLYTYVLTRIQDLAKQAQLEEKELLHRLLKASDQEIAANAKRHEVTTVDGMREQDIDIYYRFIGKIE